MAMPPLPETGHDMQPDPPHADTGFTASAAALNSLTSAAESHDDPPLDHIHAPAPAGKSHAWLRKIVPAHTMEEYETKYHLGNYVIDRKTGEKSFEEMSIYVRLGMHFLYYGKEQGNLLHWKKTLALLEEQSIKMGKGYDDPASKAHIEPFIRSFKLEDSMQEMVKPNANDYATFNEFFAREIKESARPVDEPDNDLVTSSPADCRLTAFPTIDLATKYWVKGHGFTLERLLGSREIAANFDGGSMVIARLAPQDYHCWHSPVTGTVEDIVDIPGAYYTVNPQAINQEGVLDVFGENKRSVMIVRRKPTESNIAIIAVGAMLVGSIFYVDGIEEQGANIRRGQRLGGFQYGGSTVIVLYPRGEVVLDEDLVRNSCEMQCETQMRVGWRLGVKA